MWFNTRETRGVRECLSKWAFKWLNPGNVRQSELLRLNSGDVSQSELLKIVESDVSCAYELFSRESRESDWMVLSQEEKPISVNKCGSEKRSRTFESQRRPVSAKVDYGNYNQPQYDRGTCQ